MMLFVLLVSLTVFAQKLSIKGTITDSKNEPIIGASVSEQGTSNGTITDIDGHFTIQVDRNAMLRVSYIGYKTKTVKASQGLKVTLDDDVNLLEDVVAIGYGSVKRFY